MPIFHLKRKDKIGYDEMVEAVVRADSEDHARELAAQAAPFGKDGWIVRDNVVCVRVDEAGPPSVIVAHMQWG